MELIWFNRYKTLEGAGGLDSAAGMRGPVYIRSISRYSGGKYIIESVTGLSALLVPYSEVSNDKLLRLAGALGLLHAFRTVMDQLTILWPGELAHKGKFFADTTINRIGDRNYIVHWINTSVPPSVFNLYIRPQVTSLKDAKLKLTNTLVKRIIKETKKRVRQLKRGPPSVIVTEFMDSSGLIGKKVKVELNEHIEVKGMVSEITDNGDLVLLHKDFVETEHVIPNGVCYLME